MRENINNLTELENSKLKEENNELKERLSKIYRLVKDHPNDMELGDKVRHESWGYIYESPDGGKTIFRRNAGEYDKRQIVMFDDNKHS